MKITLLYSPESRELQNIMDRLYPKDKQYAISGAPITGAPPNLSALNYEDETVFLNDSETNLRKSGDYDTGSIIMTNSPAHTNTKRLCIIKLLMCITKMMPKSSTLSNLSRR